MSNINEFLNSTNNFLFITGPCSLESEAQMNCVITESSDTSVFRAGIFKMRTRPESFQGLGKLGIEAIANLKKKHNFEFVTEVTDPRQIDELDSIVDMYQIGSRNMYNYDLLKELDSMGKPVLLKRAFSATVKEWMHAADYMPKLGESKIILCERGIRTFETTTRNTLDLNSVVYLKQNTNFKVIVDPSHGTGVKSMVAPLSKAATIVGADGLLIETHPEPQVALSDKDQQLNLSELRELHAEIKEITSLMGKNLI